MKKIIFSAIMAVLVSPVLVFAQYTPDIIVTSPDGVWTDSRAFDTLNDALTAVGGNNRTIYIAKQENFSGTIAENVRLKFLSDGSFNATGAITINTKNIDAPNQRIFYGAGAYNFADGSIVKSAWFEDINEAIDETTNDTLTLLVSESDTVDTSDAIGDDVLLKWEDPGNELIIDSGVSVYNIGNIDADDYVIVLGNGRLDFNDGVVVKSTWFKRLRTTLRHIDDSEVSLEIRKSETLDYSTTIPSNITHSNKNGAIITMDTGRVITVSGIPTSGPQHIWDGDIGAVVYSANKIPLAEWWGVSPSGGSSYNTTRLQSALNAAGANMGYLRYESPGTTLYNATLTINDNNMVFEVPTNNVILSYTGNSDAIRVNAGNSYRRVILRGFKLTTHGGTPTSGIHLGSSSATVATLEKLWVTGFDDANAAGVKLTQTVNVKIIDCHLEINYDGLLMDDAEINTSFYSENTKYRDNGRYGVNIERGAKPVFNNDIFESNNSDGLHAESTGLSIFQLKLEGGWFENNNTDTVGSQCFISGVSTNYIQNPTIRDIYITTGGGNEVANFRMEYTRLANLVSNYWSEGTPSTADVIIETTNKDWSYDRNDYFASYVDENGKTLVGVAGTIGMRSHTISGGFTHNYVGDSGVTEHYLANIKTDAHVSVLDDSNIVLWDFGTSTRYGELTIWSEEDNTYYSGFVKMSGTASIELDNIIQGSGVSVVNENPTDGNIADGNLGIGISGSGTTAQITIRNRLGGAKEIWAKFDN